MVSDQGVNHAALAFGLFLELRDVFQDFPGVRPSIGHVTGLHQVSLAAGPFTFLVDQPGRPQRSDIVVVITMNVADGDDPIDALPLVIVDLPGFPIGQVGEKQQNENRTCH